ncbi:MAG TPA: hypothetical protein VFT36_00360, partial [Methylomirabilota bacterium]|nr:hypothetical protein [Methylomirabilota bacterium]
MRYLYLDFETRSRADLRRVGAHKYAADPSTEVVLAAWTTDGLVGSDGSQTIVHWRPSDDGALDLLPGPPLYPALDAWKAYAADPRVTVVAHNAEFEREILRQKFGIDVSPHRMRCTAALAARHGLPRRLGAA